MGRFKTDLLARSLPMDQVQWFHLVLAVLATWRLTHLFVLEDGPGDVIAGLRQALGDGVFGQLMDCFFCVSLWIAAPVAYLLMNKWSEWPAFWLALSGAACLLERPSDRSTVSEPTSPEKE
jgi:hypothetical protein